MGRWIGERNDPFAGLLECKIGSWKHSVRDLQLNGKKTTKRWDLGSNPGPFASKHTPLPLDHMCSIINRILTIYNI